MIELRFTFADLATLRRFLEVVPNDNTKPSLQIHDPESSVVPTTDNSKPQEPESPPAKKPESPPATADEVTDTLLKAACATLASQGRKDEIVAFLKEEGVDRVSVLNQEQRARFMQKVEG